ncbi:MAG: hypothetical protein V4688_00045 [Pseudomonadota bacterium]
MTLWQFLLPQKQASPQTHLNVGVDFPLLAESDPKRTDVTNITSEWLLDWQSAGMLKL